VIATRLMIFYPSATTRNVIITGRISPLLPLSPAFSSVPLPSITFNILSIAASISSNGSSPPFPPSSPFRRCGSAG
jgi:hypothetical protein